MFGNTDTSVDDGCHSGKGKKPAGSVASLLGRKKFQRFAGINLRYFVVVGKDCQVVSELWWPQEGFWGIWVVDGAADRNVRVSMTKQEFEFRSPEFQFVTIHYAPYCLFHHNDTSYQFLNKIYVAHTSCRSLSNLCCNSKKYREVMRPWWDLSKQSRASSMIWWWVKLSTPSAKGRTLSGE